ncbi:MAG: oligopeptide/dipeptide transporter, ATPase subunit [Deltaproteobacteria bacterium]|jgi:oligopeptide/dipeptide ABC transporter ATP-binding protein|nr:oligopeptide/dipeptide transporter, ATPase subunit [Deltaproteobacteria bacterium]
MNHLLEVCDLSVSFHLLEGVIPAVAKVDLTLDEGEILGIVGESACGKSVTAKSIMRIIPTPPGRINSGRVLFEGRDLMALQEDGMQEVRGGKISMIFQEPMTSLNPAFTVGDQISEVFRFHRRTSKAEAWEKAVEELRRVEIPDPEKRARSYPHELSGGMRQRAMIAIALACRPRILIADEPTTALDVTIQAQILKLIAQLQREIGMSVMLITHNLGIVASLAQRVAVMYAGRIVEEGPAETVFNAHHHPYTRGLLQSVPRLDLPQRDLQEIRGTVPRLNDLPEGCTFSNRCDFAMDLCRRQEPELRPVGEGHVSRCWLDQRLW